MHRHIVLALVVCFTLPRVARAHALWTDGEIVPAWVERQCCGISDAHHPRSDQVHVSADGYRLDAYRTTVPDDQRLPSPDGSWWVFYRDYADGTRGSVYCSFGPVQGS